MTRGSPVFQLLITLSLSTANAGPISDACATVDAPRSGTVNLERPLLFDKQGTPIETLPNHLRVSMWTGPPASLPEDVLVMVDFVQAIPDMKDLPTSAQVTDRSKALYAAGARRLHLVMRHGEPGNSQDLSMALFQPGHGSPDAIIRDNLIASSALVGLNSVPKLAERILEAETVVDCEKAAKRADKFIEKLRRADGPAFWRTLEPMLVQAAGGLGTRLTAVTVTLQPDGAPLNLPGATPFIGKSDFVAAVYAE